MGKLPSPWFMLFVLGVLVGCVVFTLLNAFAGGS